MIGNHNASCTKRWKCNFCEVEHTWIATKIKAHLGGLRGHDIVSCPNVLEVVFVFFSPRFPLMVLMGNSKMSTASTNATQNLGL